MTVAGEEMAELLMSGQLAFMLAKSAAWSSSLQAALHTIASAFRQVPPHPCFKDGFMLVVKLLRKFIYCPVNLQNMGYE